MLLPNSDAAFIDDRKLIDYCLSDSHPIGKHKASLFKQALDFSFENFTQIKQIILYQVRFQTAEIVEQNQFGTLYVVDVQVVNSEKSAFDRTSWIVRNTEDFPRMTNCYVIKQ